MLLRLPSYRRPVARRSTRQPATGISASSEYSWRQALRQTAATKCVEGLWAQFLLLCGCLWLPSSILHRYTGSYGLGGLISCIMLFHKSAAYCNTLCFRPSVHTHTHTHTHTPPPGHLYSRLAQPHSTGQRIVDISRSSKRSWRRALRPASAVMCVSGLEGVTRRT
jgi:hypothetical protein